MHHSTPFLFCLFLMYFLFSYHSGSAQESFEKASGFWVTISNPNRQDSLPAPDSRRFIALSQIKFLPIHSIPLPDHKTKENITWEGIYLKEVVQKFLDIAWEKIDRLIITAPDGYSSVVSGLRMKRAETALCTFAIQGKEWSKKFGDMRIIFPDLHEMHWMNNPSEVELILKSDSDEKRTWKFFFFDSPVFTSLQRNVSNETAEWSVNDIQNSMDCIGKVFAVFTGDGQLREYLFDAVAQKMKLATDSSGYWKVRGQRVPIGFRLRKIFFFYSENVGVFTKSLTPQEQSLWQKLFASIHPSTNLGISASKILLVLASGEKIPSANFEAFQAGKSSLYQLMQMEKDARSDLMTIEVSW